MLVSPTYFKLRKFHWVLSTNLLDFAIEIVGVSLKTRDVCLELVNGGTSLTVDLWTAGITSPKGLDRGLMKLCSLLVAFFSLDGMQVGIVGKLSRWSFVYTNRNRHGMNMKQIYLHVQSSI